MRAIRLAHAQDTSTAQRVLRTGGRSVISLEGRDALSYLQGQTTNDVELLSDGGLQFSMFLNPKVSSGVSEEERNRVGGGRS